MPREIADSDDELDVIPPPRVKDLDIVEGIATPGSARELDQLDPLFNTAFDDFLSPTQRLSSYDGNHEDINDIDTSKFIDSSTNRFLEALAPSSHSPSQNTPDADLDSHLADPDMGGKRNKRREPAGDPAGHKRSWTEIEQGGPSVKNNESTKKRAKTTRDPSVVAGIQSKDALDYEAAMYDSNETAIGNHEYDGESNGDIVVNQPALVSIDARTDYTSPLDISLHLSPTNGMQATAKGHTVSANTALTGYVPHQPYTPQGDFFGANLRGGTTSNSSIGNYQSFSINPEKLGMDFDKINPFGSLSQVSLPGDLDSEETRGIAEMFRNSASYSTRTSMTSGADMNNGMSHGIEHDMQTSPMKSDGSKRTAKNRKTGRDDAQCSPPFSPITNPDDQNVMDEHLTSRHRDQSPAAIDIPEVKPAPKKRGRKPKNQKVTEAPEPEPEVYRNELHLDEHPINRTTRAGTVDSVSNVSEVSQATNSSKTGRKRKLKKSDMGPPELQSKKLPSSDLGLDSKAVIGLSPERYVPRPSKRRDRADSQVIDLTETNGALAEEEVGLADEADSKALPAKGKKGKKGKAKGVGRPAATPTKQHDEPVIEDGMQEGEEEHSQVIGGELLSPSLPDHSPDQESNIETIPGEDDEDEDDVVTKSNIRRANISVDIPVLPRSDDLQDVPAPIAEPKKRGRKRKKALEEVPVESKDEEVQRPALSERDPNIQVGKKKAVKSSAEDVDQKDDKDDNGEQELRHEEKAQTPVAKMEAAMATTPGKLNSTPLKPLSSTPLFNARARIGLSKRHSIPSLLRKVDRNKEAPKAIEKKEKMNKQRLEELEQERIAREEAEAEGREYKPLNQLRGKDGLLVEWDF